MSLVLGVKQSNFGLSGRWGHTLNAEVGHAWHKQRLGLGFGRLAFLLLVPHGWRSVTATGCGMDGKIINK